MDIKSLPVFQKKVKKFSLQEDFESRVVWRRLTEALKQNDTEAAATAKHEVMTVHTYQGTMQGSIRRVVW